MKYSEVEKKLSELVAILTSMENEDFLRIMDSFFEQIQVTDGLERLGLVKKVLKEKVNLDVYPDTEADGIVFCGKCGKMK